jgi:hypothetical protein
MLDLFDLSNDLVTRWTGTSDAPKARVEKK